MSLRHFSSLRSIALFSTLGLGCQAESASSESKAAPAAARVDAPEPRVQSKAPVFEDGSEEAARALVGKLIDTSTRSATVLSLQPEAADYRAVYGEEFGPALEAFYAPMWSKREIVPSPWGPDQTEIRISRASSEELRRWEGEARSFPRGYKRIAEFVAPEVVVFQFRFTKPGEPSGASWDGLVWVRDHWKLFPKPWKAAPEGSPFYRANEAEALCAHLQSVGASPASKASCETEMSRRLIEAGTETFKAYAACVKGLDDASRVESCTARLGGQSD